MPPFQRQLSVSCSRSDLKKRQSRPCVSTCWEVRLLGASLLDLSVPPLIRPSSPRRPSGALILYLRPAPTRKDMLRFAFCKTMGRPSRERGKCGRIIRSFRLGFSSYRRSWAFPPPDLLGQSEKRVVVGLSISRAPPCVGVAVSV